MTQLPVAELVRKNRNNLLGLALLDQSVKEDNVLFPGHSEEISIAVSAPLAAINHMQLGQGELELSSQGLNACLELAFLQRRELVEKGENRNGINGNHENLHGGSEHPEIEEELISRLLDDSEESRQKRGDHYDSQEVGLDYIRDEQFGSLLVETELLFQDEMVIDVGRQRQKLLENDEAQDKNDGMRDFAGEACGSESQQEATGPRPELGEDVVLVESDVLNLTVECADHAKLGLGSSVCLLDVSETAQHPQGARQKERT